MKKIICIIMVFIIGASLYAEEVNSRNVSGEIANKESVKSGGLIYMKLGGGAVFGKINGQEPNIGFGYRYEMDDLAVDFGLLNYISSDPMGGEGKVACQNLQIQGLYFFSPVESNSFYAGGGLAYNYTNSKHYYYNEFDFDYEHDYEYSYTGFAGVATVGYEIGRTKTIRCFFQLEATMPFGKMKNDNRNDDSYYGWALALSMGVGF